MIGNIRKKQCIHCKVTKDLKEFISNTNKELKNCEQCRNIIKKYRNKNNFYFYILTK